MRCRGAACRGGAVGHALIGVHLGLAVVTALAATDGVITSGGLGQSVWVGYADHGDLTAHWVAEAYPNRRYGKHTLMS